MALAPPRHAVLCACACPTGPGGGGGCTPLLLPFQSRVGNNLCSGVLVTRDTVVLPAEKLLWRRLLRLLRRLCCLRLMCIVVAGPTPSSKGAGPFPSEQEDTRPRRGGWCCLVPGIYSGTPCPHIRRRFQSPHSSFRKLRGLSDSFSRRTLSGTRRRPSVSWRPHVSLKGPHLHSPLSCHAALRSAWAGLPMRSCSASSGDPPVPGMFSSRFKDLGVVVPLLLLRFAWGSECQASGLCPARRSQDGKPR